MKLMIVGNTGSGKTTLLQQLMKIKKSDLGMQGATVGIDVKDWPIQIRGKGKKDLVLNVWDFAGIYFARIFYSRTLLKQGFKNWIFCSNTAKRPGGSYGIIPKPLISPNSTLATRMEKPWKEMLGTSTCQLKLSSWHMWRVVSP